MADGDKKAKRAREAAAAVDAGGGMALAGTPGRVEIPPRPRTNPFVFQVRVVRALVMRDMMSRFAHTRLSYLLGIFMPVAAMGLLVVGFGLKGRVAPSNFSLAVFVVTGYPLWQAFMGIYNRVVADGTRDNPLLMFPQITQLDIIVSTVILEFATNMIAYVLIMIMAIMVFRADFPADPVGVFLCYICCGWIGAGLGLVMSAIQRVLPMAQTGVNMFLRFGVWISGIIFMAEKIPTWVLPYISWNPILHCVEGSRQLWSGAYHSIVFDPGYIAKVGFCLTVVGLVLERMTRRYLGA
jgi:capsular polysaccharide transport system permease protein